MLRRHIRVRAPLLGVLEALDQTGFFSAKTDGSLNVVQSADCIGVARDADGDTTLDLFDEDDGADVARMVQCLRDGGLDVDQETLG